MFLKRRQSRRVSPGPRRTVEDLARSLALIREPDVLKASIASRVRELVACDAVIFCAFKLEHGAYVGDCASPLISLPERPVFLANGTLVKWLRVNEEPLLLSDASGVFEHLSSVERSTLSALRVRACVPVSAGMRIVGILLICADDAGWSLSAEDVELLVRLGHQAGLALENVELQATEREHLRNLYRAEQLAVAGLLGATVAHEIRNPLTAIRSSVQFALQSSGESESRERLLAGVLVAVDRIDHTIGSILALTRQDDSEPNEIDLVRAAEESLLVTEAYARAHQIAIVRQWIVSPLVVVGKRRELQQVCVNLLLNACQAMPNGGQATVRCDTTAVEPLMAVLQIRDTGQGIAPEHVEKVFDPFFTTKPSGTGLGLPVCRDIVTSYGGQLRLESELGRGTTATILLPLRADAHGQSPRSR
jgi:signal transduction histidine kinase